MRIRADGNVAREGMHTVVDMIFDLYGGDMLCVTGLNFYFTARNGYGQAIELVDDNGQVMEIKEFTPSKQVVKANSPLKPKKQKPKLVGIAGGRT